MGQLFLIPTRRDHGADHEFLCLSYSPFTAQVTMKFSREFHLVNVLLFEISTLNMLEGHSASMLTFYVRLLVVFFSDPSFFAIFVFPDELLAHAFAITL